MFVKQGLVGVQNGCLMTRGDLESLKFAAGSWQLAVRRLSWWCP